MYDAELILGSNVDLVSCIFTFRGIFLLIVIAVFLSVYIHLFSNYDRLTCSAQLRRRPCHRFVILPFQGLQLLVAVIVLAMAFAKPAQAQNGEIMLSCARLLFWTLLCLIILF